jgi:hypothetical protein
MRIVGMRRERRRSDGLSISAQGNSAIRRRSPSTSSELASASATIQYSDGGRRQLARCHARDHAARVGSTIAFELGGRRASQRRPAGVRRRAPGE